MKQSTKTELIKILHDVEVTTGAKHGKLISEVEAIKIDVEPEKLKDVEIFDAIEQVTGITPFRLIMKSNVRRYVDARHMASAIMIQSGMTQQAISKILNRSRVTIHHSKTVHPNLMRDLEYRETFLKISGLIKN
jgi:hypothetical protein